MRPFPFTAVVGHHDAKLALLLAAVEPAIGGVLLRGQKGSAKTTLARGLAALLPGEAPFVELPVGASEDRLVGSMDLAAALTGGEVRFRNGLLADAHGGVLYVDEVNLLPDHLVDVLLDVAAGGVNRVEREGISHSHPSRFILVGSMNPEEGELRPQLLDRFGFSVDIAASTDPAERAEAVRRRLDFDTDPEAFAGLWTDDEQTLAGRFGDAGTGASVTPELMHTVSAMCAAVGAEGLRADLVICRGAAAVARLDGRAEASVDDVRQVAPLALAHRRRRQPFDDPGIAPDELDQALDDASRSARAPSSGGKGADTASEAHAGDETPQGPREPGSTPPPAAGNDATPDGPTSGNGDIAEPEAAGRVVRLEAPSGAGSGDGRRSVVEGARGRLVSTRVPRPGEPMGSLAVAATVTAVATRRAAEARISTLVPETILADGGPAPKATVEPGDLREAVCRQRAGNLVILVVDASGSMGAQRRMEAAKGAVVSLLLDAYQRRDRVALVTFRGDAAEVVLRPTSSVEVARARLGELPTGGRTPLAAGITAALDLATAAEARGSDSSAAHRPLLVLVSDGRATSAPAGRDPVEAATAAAAEVRRRRIPAVVLDVEDGPTRLGLAVDVAAAMGARHLTLPELSAGSLDGAVRSATSAHHDRTGDV